MKNALLGLLPVPVSGHEVADVSEWLDGAVQRMKDDPLNYGFPPHEGQEVLHANDDELTLLISANRWGKTTAGMREVLWLATMTHPYKDSRPMNVIWVGFPDFPFYLRVTRDKFREWAPKKIQLHSGEWVDAIVQFHETERWCQIRRADGGTCMIYFLSYDSGREKWQGAAVDFCWLDEEMPEDIFREAMARLIDKKGQMLITLTPLSGMGWIYDRIFLAIKEKRLKGTLIEGALAWYDPEREFGIGNSRVPHLTREQIIRFAQSIPDEDERAIRIFGQFKSRSGAVYKQFRPETHVIPAFPLPKHWEVWAGVDPGYHGFAATWLALSPDGRLIVVDEYFSQEQPIKVRAKAMAEKSMAIMGVDKLSATETMIFYVDTEDPQLVMEMNLWVNERNYPMVFASLDQGAKARKAGITRVQELLTLDRARRKPLYVKTVATKRGEPILYLFDSLSSIWRDGEDVRGKDTPESRLIWELTRYLWKEPPKGHPHPQDADERTAGGAHMLAALRYAVMARIGAPDELAQEEEHPAGRHGWVWDRLKEMERKAEEDWSVED